MDKAGVRFWVLGVLVVVAVNPLAAQVFSDDVFTEERVAARNRAIKMSLLFPGLGQIALGSKVKGFSLFSGGLVSLVAAINGQENHSTVKGRHKQARDKYLGLQQRGRYEEAQEIWEDIQDMEDDLDRYNTMRQIIFLSAGIYAYNVVDILFFTSPKERVAQSSRPGFTVATQWVNGSPGIGVTRRF